MGEHEQYATLRELAENNMDTSIDVPAVIVRELLAERDALLGGGRTTDNRVAMLTAEVDQLRLDLEYTRGQRDGFAMRARDAEAGRREQETELAGQPTVVEAARKLIAALDAGSIHDELTRLRLLIKALDSADAEGGD